MTVRSALSAFVIIVTITALAIPSARISSASGASIADSSYVLVGGQNGTWFVDGQAPRLERIGLSNDSMASLAPVQSEGTVWSGGWNGSQWLVSGWGDDDGPNGSNPYIYLYNGMNQVPAGSLDLYQAESTWHGGDVFATSYNGKEWLLSGLGSGVLPSFSSLEQNHMSLALFDGYDFTDLSALVPRQRDAILYTNAWNGRYWLVGGGFDDDGILLSFDGTNLVDLTGLIAQSVFNFGSVQAVAWNGYYWLVGGQNFLAAYDGNKFTDLTYRLDSALKLNSACCTTVNAIAWNGAEWMIGGGAPIAQTSSDSQAWLVTYSPPNFVDLTQEIRPHATDLIPDSSILAITATQSLWIIGGYSNNHGSLYEYFGKSFTNLSELVSNYTYVNWVGAGATQNNVQIAPTTYNPIFPDLKALTSQSIQHVRETLQAIEVYRFD